MFDLDFVTTHFEVTNVGHYLGLIKKASKGDLRRFRAEVKRHKKTHKQRQAFSNVPDYSTHDAIIAAIAHELRRRSFTYPVYSATLPVKRFLASFLRGLELQDHRDLGVLYTVPRRRRSPLHMPMRELGALVGRFFIANWKWLIGTAIALLRVLAKWLT